MPGGRPRQPDVLKKLKGTLQPCRVNNDAPKTLPGMPEIPRGLSAVGKRKFKELAQELYQMKVITTHDAHLLELIAHQWENYQELKKELKKNGRFFYGERTETEISEDGEKIKKVTVLQTKVKAHPALAAYQQAWANIMKGLQECGLTPTMRSKVKVVKEEEKSSFAKFMAGG